MDWSNDILRNSVLCLLLFIFGMIGERTNEFGSFLRWLLVFAGFLIAAIPFDSEHGAAWFPLFICGVVIGYWLRGRDDRFYVDFFDNARKRASEEHIKLCFAAADKATKVEAPLESEKRETMADSEESENLVLADMRQDEVYKGQLRQAINSRLKSLNWSRNGQDVEEPSNDPYHW